MNEYYKTKNINIDLIIINEEESSYKNYVKDEIEKILFSIQQERDNSTPNTSLGNGDSSMIIAREMNKFLNR